MKYIEKYKILIDQDGTMKTPEGFTVNAQKTASGYPELAFKNAQGIWRRVRVQNLVAEAYLPNPYNSRMLRLLDGNKENLHVHNMEWVVGDRKILGKQVKRTRANRDEEGL